MKFFYLLFLSTVIFSLCSCAMFYDKQAGSSAAVQSPKPLVVPVGKNWQITEEAPKLTDERSRLPFQTEQSVQPGGARPVAPEDNRKIETVR